MNRTRVSTADRPRIRLTTSTALATALTLGLLTTATAGAQEWRKLLHMPVEKWEPGTVVLDVYEAGGSPGRSAVQADMRVGKLP